MLPKTYKKIVTNKPPIELRKEKVFLYRDAYRLNVNGEIKVRL